MKMEIDLLKFGNAAADASECTAPAAGAAARTASQDPCFGPPPSGQGRARARVLGDSRLAGGRPRTEHGKRRGRGAGSAKDSK